MVTGHGGLALDYTSDGGSPGGGGGVHVTAGLRSGTWGVGLGTGVTASSLGDVIIPIAVELAFYSPKWYGTLGLGTSFWGSGYAGNVLEVASVGGIIARHFMIGVRVENSIFTSDFQSGAFVCDAELGYRY